MRWELSMTSQSLKLGQRKIITDITDPFFSKENEDVIQGVTLETPSRANKETHKK